jgi:3-oxoacyl-[acyl-carrier-protein] synthase III
MRQKQCGRVIQEIRIMADDKTNRGAQDRARINTNEEYEIRYWTQQLGVSSQKLNETVQKVGNSAAAVRKALQQSQH